MSDEMARKQMEAVVFLLHKVMSDFEDSLASIKANDLIKAFNEVGQSAELGGDPMAIAGAWAVVMEVIASTNRDNTAFMEKMRAVMSLA